MDSEIDWTPPPIALRIRNPEVHREWLGRVVEWERANPELSAAWDEANREEDERYRRQQEFQSRLMALERAGVPERVRTEWRLGLRETVAVKAAREHADGIKTFLLLLGSPGAGKTIAAAAALVRGGVFRRAVELSRLSSFDREDQRTFLDACRVRLLVLDDLGSEMLHDGWRPMLDELIDIRYGDRLKTIITSNLDTQTFKARYGERIADRIRHDGDVVLCGDQSLRKRSL